jgi:hypothetical protein
MLILLGLGRVGHQKRIRKLVRLITYASAVHVAVWEECYWRWRALSEMIFESLADSADVAENPRPPAWQEVRLMQFFYLVGHPSNMFLRCRSIALSGKTLLYFWLLLVVLASRKM